MSEKIKYDYRCSICGNHLFIGEKKETVREAKCRTCGASKRNSDVALAIIRRFKLDENSTLQKELKKIKNLHIYEAGSSGALHDTLKAVPNYVCSEYYEKLTPRKKDPVTGTRCENLECLSFPDNSFDLVITQDCLEHVANPDVAFKEIDRVLKPSGCHIFTVPVHESRNTVTRVSPPELKSGNIHREVRHGDPLNPKGCIVFTDWGCDILDYLNNGGYPTKVIVKSDFYSLNRIPFIDNDSEYNTYLKYFNQSRLLDYFFYNSIVFASDKSNNGFLEFTGERFLPYSDPGVTGIEIHLEHLHRYTFARRFVKGKKVLDLASGEGYGSYLLSGEAASVVGLDIDLPAVTHAKGTHIRENLSYVRGSMLDIPLEDDSFDVVICFEAIEHVEGHEKLMSEIKRVLKKDGILVVSTPNKDFFNQDPNHNNPFHLKELSCEEFRHLLGEHFKNVQVLGQRVYTCSNIWDLSSDNQLFDEEIVKWRRDGFFLPEEQAKTPVYLIAVVSDGKIDKKAKIGNILTDESNLLINRYNAFKYVRGMSFYGREIRPRVLKRFLPVGSRRRNIFYLARNGLTILKDDGCICLLKRFKHYCSVSGIYALKFFSLQRALDDLKRDKLMQERYMNMVPRVIESNPSCKKDLCIFCHFDAKNVIKDYIKYMVESIHAAGFEIVFVSSSSEIKDLELEKIRKLCHKIIIKENIGYDFGSWAKAMQYVDLDKYGGLMLINDSCFGPFFDLKKIIATMNERSLDLWGITDSFQGRYHVQSYFMVFSHRVITSREFKDFFGNFSVKADKFTLIRKYEIGLSQMLIKKGYKIGAYCRYHDVVAYVKENMPDSYYRKIMFLEPVNPMHLFWCVLIEDFNCPFVKRELIKVNPEKIDLRDLESVVNNTGYDYSLIK